MPHTPCRVTMHCETCIIVMFVIVWMEESSRECTLYEVVIHWMACHEGLDDVAEKCGVYGLVSGTV